MKKPIESKLWPALIAGFIGIILILNPDRRIFDWGAVYGLLSGVWLAFTLVFLRSTSSKETVFHFIFYFFTIAAVITFPFALADWKIEGVQTLLLLIAFGSLSLIGQMAMFQGLKYGHVHELAPLSYSLVVFSGIFECLVFNRAPQPFAYLGIISIIGSGVWVAWSSRVPKN